ncbi:MAG TPA: ATP-binding protein [Planktothrix sp.]|jgi:PAS domain S-box-containing protein
MNVLIVEDNPTQSNLLRISLQRRGLQVFCATTLQEALTHLKEPKFDVILLDLSLPDSNGIETFYGIRNVAVGVPTVVFTGLDDQEVAIEALKNGAQDYLIKGVAGDDSVVRCLRYAIERNKVEVALRQSEKRLRVILENSYDAFISMDSKWRIKDWNAQAERTFGWTRAQVLGRSLALIVPHHLRKQYSRDVEDYFDKNQDKIWRMTNEIMACHHDGHEFPIEIGIFRIIEDNDYMYCAFVRDISERKHMNELLERRVQERTTELTQSVGELEQFAKIASHDLQEPLRAVQGFANLLSESTSGKLGEDEQEFIAFILDGTERMQSLIQSVLLHSSIKKEEKDVSTACNSVIEEVLANLDASIKDNGATLEIDSLPEVAVERSQLVQLFQNLFSNAIKYRGPQPPRLWVRAERSVNEWLFFVRDNGIGIEPQYAEKIFDMFARLHGKTQYSGTGMGLAICKKIVNSHGGNIWVESEPGQGCIFLFTLPAVVQKSVVGEENNGK